MYQHDKICAQTLEVEIYYKYTKSDDDIILKLSNTYTYLFKTKLDASDIYLFYIQSVLYFII